MCIYENISVCACVCVYGECVYMVSVCMSQVGFLKAEPEDLMRILMKIMTHRGSESMILALDL